MNFKQDVIEKSFEKPVVVDFWAPWCAPCRVLGPTIESLANEQGDKWELVKVNTEDHFELAEQYNIRSIPNVKMFYRGEMVAEFMGALPRPSIERWLEEHLPDGRKESLSTILERLDGDGALSELEAFISQNPDVVEARLALAQRIVITNPARALALVEPISIGDKLEEPAQALRTIAELIALEPDDSPAGKLLAEAKLALQQHQNEAAIKAVIEATTLDKGYQNDLPRRLAIALFQTWGNDDPLTKNYRWRFDMALY